MLSSNPCKTGKYTPIDATDLDEFALRKAQAEVGETTESRSNGLLKLKQKLQGVKDLNPCLEEDFLLGYLRVAKFDVSKAFARIQKYYYQQDRFPEEFRNCSPDSLRKIRQLRYYWVSPHRTEDNAVLMINKHGLWDPNEMSFEVKAYGDLLGCNSLIRNPITQMCGVVVLQDYSTFTFQKLRSHTLGTIRMWIELFQGCYPCRWREVHIIQESVLFKIFFRILRPFLSRKMQKRVFIHAKNDSWESLHVAIPPEILPEEYGGLVKQSELIHLLENVHDLDQEFQKQLIYGLKKNLT